MTNTWTSAGVFRMTSMYAPDSHRRGATGLIRATATMSPSSMPSTVAPTATWIVSDSPASSTSRLLPTTSQRTRNDPGQPVSVSVVPGQRQGLGLEPLPQLLGAAAAGRDTGAVVVVDEVVEPVDPGLVAQ